MSTSLGGLFRMPVVGLAWMAELAPRHVARRAAAAAARPARRLCRPRAAVAVTGTTSAAICRCADECTVSAGELQRRRAANGVCSRRFLLRSPLWFERADTAGLHAAAVLLFAGMAWKPSSLPGWRSALGARFVLCCLALQALMGALSFAMCCDLALRLCAALAIFRMSAHQPKECRAASAAY